MSDLKKYDDLMGYTTNVKTVLTNIKEKQWKLMSKEDRTNLLQKNTGFTSVKT